MHLCAWRSVLLDAAKNGLLAGSGTVKDVDFIEQASTLTVPAILLFYLFFFPLFSTDEMVARVYDLYIWH